jgi:hypothetical protein
MTQREPDFETGDGVIDLAELVNFDSYLKSFPLAKDVEKPPQFTGQDKTQNWFEQLYTWAAKYSLGPSGVPLLYILRREEADIDDDPGWYEPSLKEDIALRGPHSNDNVFWHEDNTVVWNMLVFPLHPTKEYEYAQPFERAMDGNAAYNALKECMLGPPLPKHWKPKLTIPSRPYNIKGRLRAYPLIGSSPTSLKFSSTVELNTQRIRSSLFF